MYTGIVRAGHWHKTVCAGSSNLLIDLASTFAISFIMFTPKNHAVFQKEIEERRGSILLRSSTLIGSDGCIFATD